MKKEQFFSKVRVKRRPKTGIGKQSRKRNGCIILENSFIGKTVIVMNYNDFIILKRRLKKANKIIKDIAKINNEQI